MVCITCVVLQAFKDGEVRLLICTDLAARGLDISGLPYVVNVTLPDRAEDYIHRVGRVGAAETLKPVLTTLGHTHHVVNVTLPDRAEDYIHRVGRVGAAETLKPVLKTLRHTHHVVNVTLPDRAEDYIHRVGRVGACPKPEA